MNAGAAFSIISIATTLVALIFGILMIIKIKCIIIVPFVFVSLSIVTILITWATVASTKSLKMCGIDGAKYAPQKYATYGAGFALMVTAWCLQVLNLVLLIIVACC
ncbi:amastin-like surface protein-like protein [Angomonas deanei]|uniref:Amastin surface glycoprotein, putative n=1 Tax=Angomonas deanei TaxID=59799 RepID=A0A7G2CRH8_9TRYP|nr:amastin-like surface protein-like protein [Angomonas deanei]CAD2221611.1 Amastin surface glycoprotein, putative [Angomonas deanei]|eukprot:EPY25930.1 amastin-like surface protein-like protein [Angomonas deanei]